MSKLVYVMRCIFDASRKVVKDFDSKIKESFLESCHVSSWSM